MKQAVFLVDGYNFYHSIVELVKKDPSKNYLKWVDLRKLFTQFISDDEEIADIYYYTAKPTHTRPDVQDRYEQLTKAYRMFLRIKVVYGKFKKKEKECKNCHVKWVQHEEKESDVNLAVQIVKNAYEKVYDTTYVVTQDSDLAPAVKLAEKVNAGHVKLLTPVGRPHSNEISRILGKKQKSQIKEHNLEHALMPEYFHDPKSGNIVIKRPTEYTPPTS